MFPYWLLFTAYAAGALNYRWQPAAVQRLSPILIGAGVLTALMIGLRFEVGGDWQIYLQIFLEISYTDLTAALSRTDPGYALFNWIASALGLQIWMANLLCALVSIWGLLKFAKYQPNPWLVILVAVPYFIIVVCMGYTRQAAAIALIMAGLTTIDGRSYIRFGIYLLLATAFHKTALIVIPLIGFTVVRNRLPMLLMAVVTAVVLYYVFLEASVDKLTSGYVTSDYDSSGAGIRLAMNLIPGALFLRLQRRFALPEVERKLWRNFAIASFVGLLMLMVMSSSTAVDRLALYLIPLQMYVLGRLPYVLGREGQPNPQVLLGVVVYSALVQFVWLNFGSFSDLWVPYRFWPLEASENVVPGG